MLIRTNSTISVMDFHVLERPWFTAAPRICVNMCTFMRPHINALSVKLKWIPHNSHERAWLILSQTDHINNYQLTILIVHHFVLPMQLQSKSLKNLSGPV